MKATVEIDEDLYRRLKAEAALRGRKIKELVTDGVRMVLALPRETTLQRKRMRLPLIDSGLPGKLSIPDDMASRLEIQAEIERHEASLR